MVVPVPTTNSKTLHERPLWLMYKKICFIKKKMKLDIFYFVYQSWCFLLISPRGLALQKQHKNMYCPLMSKQENMNKWFFFQNLRHHAPIFLHIFICVDSFELTSNLAPPYLSFIWGMWFPCQSFVCFWCVIVSLWF